jgi:hypothetical protein
LDRERKVVCEQLWRRRHLAIDRPDAPQRFTVLTEALSTVDSPQALTLPKNVRLDPKDQPILRPPITVYANTCSLAMRGTSGICTESGSGAFWYSEQRSI